MTRTVSATQLVTLWPDLRHMRTREARSDPESGMGIPDGMPLVIKKWTIPREEVDLVASFFSLEDGNLILSWPTTAGEIYQVQRSTDLESWENIGVTLTGNGTTMSYSQPSTSEKVFLRVVLP